MRVKISFKVFIHTDEFPLLYFPATATRCFLIFCQLILNSTRESEKLAYHAMPLGYMRRLTPFMMIRSQNEREDAAPAYKIRGMEGAHNTMMKILPMACARKA